MPTVIHPLRPIWDTDSRVLILGTMPSPKSRELAFYYAHPQNRFWKVLALVFGQEPGTGREERTAFLLEHRIALWDVLASCDIRGASDSSIKNALPNDLSVILDSAPIGRIFTTGTTAYRLYQKLQQPLTGRPAVMLPSTSPANCRIPLDALAESYRQIREELER